MPDEVLFELHVPIAAGDSFEWIDELLDEFAERLEDPCFCDDGEEMGEEYVFFLYGPEHAQLADACRAVLKACKIPRRDRVYGVSKTDHGDESGRRVVI